MTLAFRRAAMLLAATLLTLLSAAPAAPAAAQRLQCDRCHGELELLRQRVPSLADAERLLAPASVLLRSAHAQLACVECHAGVASYPHGARVATRTCTSCHAAPDSAWRGSVHALVQDREPVACRACHGVHDVASVAQMKEPDGIARANAKCSACHESQKLPESHPHAGKALCASCHGSHAVYRPQQLASWLHPLRQLETCGACHDSIADVWRSDVHADTLRALHAAGADLDPELLPGCTSCHSGHDMVPTDSAAFVLATLERCAGCHEHSAETFFESYHGQATALGSRITASCADCHGAHGIRPSSDPASHTAPANLVQTCGTCHERASAGFVSYDSHPEPMNRARNPWVFLVFWAMNALLVGTMTLWAAHTGLWWLRLKRGKPHSAPTTHQTGGGPAA